MVQGLADFGKHFEDFQDNYIIIGGTATVLILENASLKARSTQDVDMVLHLEENKDGFLKKLNEYIILGGYKNYERNEQTFYYRFLNPKNENYPKQLEFFYKGDLKLNVKYTRVSEGSLPYISAIIFDNNFYEFILKGQAVLENLSILKNDYLIVLKAYAWNNLSRSKAQSKDIDKHKTDILNLRKTLIEGEELELTQEIFDELQNFLNQQEETEDYSVLRRYYKLKRYSV